MRILSPSELATLTNETKTTQLPVDLRHEYMPTIVSFKNYSGEHKRDLHKDGVEIMKRELDDVVDRIGAVYIRDISEGRLKQMRVDSIDACSFSDQTSQLSFDTSVNTEIFFPTRRFLWNEELKKLDIDPKPGLLYFFCNSESVNVADITYILTKYGGLTHNNRFILKIRLAESVRCLLSELANMKDDNLENMVGDIKKFRSIHQRLLYHDASTVEENDLVELVTNILSLEEKFHQFLKDNHLNIPWTAILPVVAVCLATNSTIVWKACKENDKEIVAKTVLSTQIEYPPGFVIETLDCLLESGKSAQKLAERFEQLIFEEPQAKQRKPRAVEATSDRPMSISQYQYLGPDESWKNCSDPWFVQAILLSRLIGGSLWPYTLGILQEKHSKFN